MKKKKLSFCFLVCLLILFISACGSAEQTKEQINGIKYKESFDEEEENNDIKTENETVNAEEINPEINIDENNGERNNSEELYIFNKEFDEPGSNDSYKNIAVFCVDSTKGILDSKTKSKGIMIFSVNERTKEVKVVNIQHLMYWNIDGADKYQQAWYGYYDGPAAAISALNRNLDMAITDYITIGFEGMEQLAASVGGIQVYVDETEMEKLNEKEGTKYLPDYLEENLTVIENSGLQTLDSGLSVAYFMGHLRGIGNSVQVVERQQEVINNLALKLMVMDSQQVEIIFDDLYSNYISTSLGKDDYFDFVNQIVDSGISKTYCFPTKSLSETNVLGSNGTCMCTSDLKQSVIDMQQFLFMNKSYQSSQGLEDTSLKLQEKIASYN